MKHQDNITNKIKKATESSDLKPYPNKEQLWENIEISLEKKQKKNTIWVFKRVGIAAVFLLIISLSFDLFKDNQVDYSKPIPPTKNSRNTKQTEHEQKLTSKKPTSEVTTKDVQNQDITFKNNLATENTTLASPLKNKQNTPSNQTPPITKLVDQNNRLDDIKTEIKASQPLEVLEEDAYGYISTASSLTKRKKQLDQKLQGKAHGVDISNKPTNNNFNLLDSLTKAEIQNNESYKGLVENPFTLPQLAPLSTFSIDVDNASYTNVRRMINLGQPVNPDAVRIEEFINYFNYDYPKPKGKHPFAIHTEQSDCPWNKKHQLLKIGLQGKDIPTKNLPASNLVFLIDVSGSMSDQNKLPLLKSAFNILVNQLREQDKVSIVVYAGAAGLVLPPTSGQEKDTIMEALNNLSAGGSTAGGQGIELAYKIAQEHFVKEGNNRVIIATDGDFNVGASSDNSMEKLIEKKRQTGIFLTCLGFGMGNFKDSKMEILANKGNGNYAYIDTMQEANRYLGKAFKGNMYAIAKDVKIQIEFNPKHVQAYRLIGYENRLLNTEDFKDDTKDAGELGANHQVTALYEIIPTGIKSNYLEHQINSLKYQKPNFSNLQNHKNEIATIKFRYKKPNGNKSKEISHAIKNNYRPLIQTTDDFKFASAVCWFGLHLRKSQYIEYYNQTEVIKIAQKSKGNDQNGYRSEFIRLAQLAKNN